MLALLKHTMFVDPFVEGWFYGGISAMFGAYLIILLVDNWNSERFWQYCNYFKSRCSYVSKPIPLSTRGPKLTSRMDIAEVRWMYNRAKSRGLKHYAPSNSEFEVRRDKIGNWYHLYMGGDWKVTSIDNKSWGSPDIVAEFEYLKSQITDKKQGVIIGDRLVIQDDRSSFSVKYSLRSSTKTLGCSLTDAERAAVDSLYLQALEKNIESVTDGEFTVFLDDITQNWYHKSHIDNTIVNNASTSINNSTITEATVGVKLSNEERIQVNNLYIAALEADQTFIQDKNFVLFKGAAGVWRHHRKE